MDFGRAESSLRPQVPATRYHTDFARNRDSNHNDIAVIGVHLQREDTQPVAVVTSEALIDAVEEIAGTCTLTHIAAVTSVQNERAYYGSPAKTMSITSTLVDRADIRFHEAANSLRSFVGCFWVVTAERDASIHIVPDGSTAISIQFQGSGPSGWFLRGPLVRPETRRYASGATVIGIRLRPGVAFMLSGIAAHAMVGRNLRLSDVQAFHELVDAQPSPRTPTECIDGLQRFLIGRLQHAKVHRVVARAIREIEREHGCLPISQIAARCEVSLRHLNRLMRMWVGYGPKRFASIVRFQETLSQIEHSPGRSAARLASEIGFFDQAHLTTNMTRFAGATPRNLASSSTAEFSKTRCDDPP